MGIYSRLDPWGNGGPGDDHDDEGGAGRLVVGADEDHDQGHQLHAPGDQVESPVVRRRSHPVDDTETDEARYQDVADHKMEVLLCEVFLDVVPGLGHQVQGEAVDNTDPGEQGLFDSSLEEVGHDDQG